MDFRHLIHSSTLPIAQTKRFNNKLGKFEISLKQMIENEKELEIFSMLKTTVIFEHKALPSVI